MKYKYAPDIKIGDIFTRVDKNGIIWKAEVINRTEYFVDVKKYHPYEVKFQTGWFEWEYEKRIPEPTVERAKICTDYKEIETDEIVKSIWGEYKKKIDVPTGKYFIAIKEDYSKYSQYDKLYWLDKGVEKC